MKILAFIKKMTNYGKRKNLGQRKKILAKKNKKNLVPRLGAAVFDLSFLSLDPRHQSLQAHLRCFYFRVWVKFGRKNWEQEVQ